MPAIWHMHVHAMLGREGRRLSKSHMIPDLGGHPSPLHSMPACPGACPGEGLSAPGSRLHVRLPAPGEAEELVSVCTHACCLPCPGSLHPAGREDRGQPSARLGLRGLMLPPTIPALDPGAATSPWAGHAHMTPRKGFWLIKADFLDRAHANALCFSRDSCLLPWLQAKPAYVHGLVCTCLSA